MTASYTLPNEQNTKPYIVDVVITGTEQEDEVLTATPEAEPRGPYTISSYAYQWYRSDDADATNRIAISGATSSTYTLVTADVSKFIDCEVIAIQSGGANPTSDAFISRATGAILAAGSGDAIATFIANETTAGNWSLYDEAWVIVSGNSTPLVGIKNSNVLTNNGPATIGANGAVFTGTEYLDTGYNLSTAPTTFAQNNGALTVYVQTFNNAVDQEFFGIAPTPGYSLINHIAANSSKWAINRNNTGGQAHTGLTAGTMSVARTGANTAALYNNGSSVDTTTGASAAVLSTTPFIGASNNGTGAEGFADATISFFAIHGASGFDFSSQHTNIQTMLTALGAST